jgi:hypothetical protein
MHEIKSTHSINKSTTINDSKETHAFNHITQVLPWFTPLGYIHKDLALSSFIIVVPKIQRLRALQLSSVGSRSIMRWAISHQAPQPVI